MTDQPIREGERSGRRHSDPQDAEAEKRSDGADREDKPRRELIRGDAGKDSDVLADVVGNTKNGDMALVESQNGL